MDKSVKDRGAGDRARRYAVMAAAMGCVIIYGSLYPFAFHFRSGADGALRALFSTWGSWASRGDSIANVLLYVPFGYFAVPWLLERHSRVRTCLLTTLAGLALSTSIELAQYYDAGRDSSMADMYTNTLGTLLGAAAGVSLLRERRHPLSGRMERQPFAVLLLACWMGSQLYPFLPVFDVQKYATAVMPLFHAWPWSLSLFSPFVLSLYRYFVASLTAALLLETLFGLNKGRRAVLVLVSCLLVARVAIADVVLTPAEVLGGGMAVALWMAGLWKLPARTVVVTRLFIGLVALEALAPFQFNSTARPFGWIPFLSVMQAPAATGVRVFLEKAFLYGSLTWLLVRSGRGWSAATLFGFLLVLLLRFGQVYLPGRSAEITDAIMVLMLAVALKWMESDGGPIHGSGSTDGAYIPGSSPSAR